MATACPTPQLFHPAHGDPETTLQRFETWYEGMQTYLMFARRLDARDQPSWSEVRGHRIVIPTALYSTAIELSHMGHVGPTTTIAHLRERVWFPNLAAIAQAHIEACFPCQTATPHHTHQPLRTTETLPRPWHTLHMDYKGPINGSYYIHVAIDAFTKFVSVEVTKSTSGEILLPILDKLWATHGVCTEIISDNGPPYRYSGIHTIKNKGTGWTDYRQKNAPLFLFVLFFKKDIHHNPMAPQHPQGNGLAENFMKKIAKVVHTATLENKDPRREVFKMVLVHNATIHTTTKVSPAQALMGRDIKAMLPNIHHPPLTEQQQDITNNINTAKLKNKTYHEQKQTR